MSVCIPVYNGERFLAATIRSVVNQTFRDFELVLLDNASTDRSAEIMRSFTDPRIRIERNLHTISQTDNWNRVVELSRAPLVKLLCADDLLHPHCLELQVGPMRSGPGLALVAGRRHMIDERGRVIAPRRGLRGLIGVRTPVEVARRVVRSGANPIGEPGSVLVRREHFDAAGAWRTERSYVLDLDLWMRLLHHGHFLGLPHTLAAFRIAQATLSAYNDHAIYDEQRLIIDDLGKTALFDIRRRDLRIGRMAAPAGRARRRALYVASTLSAQPR